MTNKMIDLHIELVSDFIDVIALFEIISEEYENYYTAENDECVKRLKQRIEDAKKLKLKYLTILN